MEIHSGDILNSIFKHLDNENKYPIDNIKTMIYKYEEQQQNVLESQTAKQQRYYETYESQREIQNNAYDAFMREKQQLWYEFNNKQSKDLSYKLLRMKFDYREIPDIYSYNAIYNSNLNADNSVMKHKPIDKKNNIPPKNHIRKPVRQVKEKKEKNIPKPNNGEKFWNIDQNDHKNDRLYWKKKKDDYHYDFPGIPIQMVYDTQDADAIINDKITSSTINLFITDILKKNKLFNKYVVLSSEFYANLQSMIDNDESLDGLLYGHFDNFDKDWSNKNIIIPININNVHWIFAHINPYDRKIYVIDPYGDTNKDVYHNINIWRDWYIGKFPNLSNEKYEASYNIDNIIRQTRSDTKNCGVFVMMFARYLILENKYPTVDDFAYEDIDDIRAYIYHVITNICKCPPGKTLNVKTKRCNADK